MTSICRGLGGATGNRVISSGDGVAFRHCVVNSCFRRILCCTGLHFSGVANNHCRVIHNRDHSGQVDTKLRVDIHSGFGGGRESVSSLSNKRSFRTSLTLTLKLSSVVRREGNKVELSSVFVSRKFNSLSGSDLTSTVRALGSLANGNGHLINVVSRVDRLGGDVNGGVRIINAGSNDSVGVVASWRVASCCTTRREFSIPLLCFGVCYTAV